MVLSKFLRTISILALALLIGCAPVNQKDASSASNNANGNGGSASGGTIAGNGEIYNGGDPLFGSLAAARSRLVWALQRMRSWNSADEICRPRTCPSDGDTAVCAVLSSLDDDEIDYCGDFVRNVADAILALNLGSSPTPFALKYTPLEIQTGDHVASDVAAITELGAAGPIIFHADSLRNMSAMALTSLVFHEFGHKGARNPGHGPIVDTRAYGPFAGTEGGRRLLDVAGAAIALYAKANEGNPGMLDASFNSMGLVTTSVSSSDDTVYAVALQADGKIVSVGSAGEYWAITRHRADGALDTSFGSSGTVVTSLGGGVAYGVAIQPNGKIVVVGVGHSSTNYSIGVVRLNTDGSFDPTFGSGGRAVVSPGTQTTAGRAVALQADGKILVGGYTYPSGSSLGQAVLMRLNANGTVDSAFNGNRGYVMTSFGASEWGLIHALIARPDGTILAGCVVSNQSTGKKTMVLASYEDDGTLDDSFSGDGIAQLSPGTRGGEFGAMALQADGKILVTGQALQANGDDFVLLRLEADGDYDRSFGHAGIVTIDQEESLRAGSSVQVQPDGRIVVSGRAASTTTYTSLGVLRFEADGDLDTTLNGTGRAIALFDNFVNGFGALQPDGKIVLGGTSVNGTKKNFSLFRLWL